MKRLKDFYLKAEALTVLYMPYSLGSGVLGLGGGEVPVGSGVEDSDDVARPKYTLDILREAQALHPTPHTLHFTP